VDRRAFSSPSTSPFQFHLDILVGDISIYLGSFKRAFERLPLFRQYRKHHVFPPAMGLVSQLSLFAKLQRPTHTDIDALEFLNGAHQAVDTSLTTMFSKEVVNHALGRISKSPATKTLRQLLSPACFDMKLQGLKMLKSTMLSMELNELEIKSVHLGDVTFERLTLAEVKQQEIEDLHNIHSSIEAAFQHVNQRIKTKPMPTKLDGITDIGSIVIGEHDHTILVERMRLNVEIETTETMTTAYFIRPKSECVTIDKIGIWIFEAIVSNPGEMNWRVQTFVEGPPGQKLVVRSRQHAAEGPVIFF
jgi:hypothetical protein